MTPAELRDIIGSVKASTDSEARRRRYLSAVLAANEDGSTAAAELVAAARAFLYFADLLRQP